MQTSTQQAPTSESAASGAASSDAGAAVESGAEAGGESEVDIDKLAHRVYANIKRRLSVERERVRR